MRLLKNWIKFFDLTDAVCDEDEVKKPSDTVKRPRMHCQLLLQDGEKKNMDVFVCSCIYNVY